MHQHISPKTNEQWIALFKTFLLRRFPGSSTTRHYISDLNIFSSYNQKSFSITQRSDIDKFVDHEMARGLKPSTVKRRISSLKVFFDFFCDESLLPSSNSPVSPRRHTPRQPKPLPRDLKDNQIKELLSKVDNPRDMAIFSLMLYGGLRVGEVTQLTPSSFDDSGSEEAPVKILVCGKGQKERIVYLLRKAYAPVLAYIQKKTKRPKNEPLFLNNNGQPITISGIQWLTTQYSKKVGFHFTAHQLRHTCARWLAEGYMPLLSLASFLGHSDMQTTQRYINGANPALRKDYEQAFNKALTSPESPITPSVGGYSLDKKDLPKKSTIVRAYPSNFAPPPSFFQLPRWMHQDLRDWINHRWYQWKISRRQENALRILKNIRHFFTEWLSSSSPKNWSELQKEDVQNYIKASFERGLSAVTVKTSVGTLFNFLHFLEDRKRIAHIPERPEIKLPKPLPKHLSSQEFMALENEVDKESKKSDSNKLLVALYCLLMYAGLRISEALDLKIEDIDLHARKIRVNEGKNSRDRIVFLTEKAQGFIAEYLEEMPNHPSDLVFSKEGDPLSYGQAWRMIKMFGYRVGIDKLYPQRLRHTYATTLLNNGMALEALRMLMGHENMNTTLIYAKLANQTIQQQYEEAMQLTEKEKVTTN